MLWIKNGTSLYNLDLVESIRLAEDDEDVIVLRMANSDTYRICNQSPSILHAMIGKITNWIIDQRLDIFPNSVFDIEEELMHITRS